MVFTVDWKTPQNFGILAILQFIKLKDSLPAFVNNTEKLLKVRRMTDMRTVSSGLTSFIEL